jgi:hypothetical protein
MDTRLLACIQVQIAPEPGQRNRNRYFEGQKYPGALRATTLQLLGTNLEGTSKQATQERVEGWS